LIAYLRKVEDNNRGNLLSVLVRAMIPVVTPDFKIDPSSTRS
jgi:hypothetical protein